MNLAAEHAAGSIVLAVVGGIKYSIYIVNSSIQYHSPQPVLSPSAYLAAVLLYALQTIKLLRTHIRWILLSECGQECNC